jgi:hypothetical protein
MQNTYQDLKACYNNWNEVESGSEEEAREDILKLAQKIVDTYGKELKED